MGDYILTVVLVIFCLPMLLDCITKQQNGRTVQRFNLSLWIVVVPPLFLAVLLWVVVLFGERQ